MRLSNTHLLGPSLVLVGLVWFLVSPKSVSAQISETSAQCIGEGLAEYMNDTTSNVGSLTHVKLTSPVFNMTNTISVQLYNAMNDFNAEWGPIDVMAGNVYTVSGQNARDFYASTGWRGIVQGLGKNIIFTEFGDFEPIANDGLLQGEFETFAGYSEVLALNYFNAFGGNPEFDFHVIAPDRLQQVTSSAPQKAGVNSALGIDGSGGFSAEVADLGLTWTVEIAFGPGDIGATIDAVNAAHSRGVTPVVRLCACHGPSCCAFYDEGASYPAEPLVEFIQQLDAAVADDVYVVAGPNEPQSEPWVAPTCQVEITAEPHVCYQNFCEGTIHNPCRYTPQKDCSYPVDMVAFLAPEVDPEIEQYAFDYLDEYLPLTRVGRGLPFDFEAKFDDQAQLLCTQEQQIPYLQSLCSQQAGDGFVAFDLDDLTINALLEPENAEITTHRRDHATGTINHPAGNTLEEPGSLNKLLPIDYWVERISAMVDLKEFCWNYGQTPYPWFINHNYFGRVRCMNYQQFPGSLGTERDIFVGGFLDVCRRVHRSSGVDKIINTSQCKSAMNQLYDLNRPMWTAVFNLPIVPYATFPVFGGIDQLGAQSNIQNDRFKAGESNVQTEEFSLPINKTGEFVSGLGDLGTTYYVFPFTAGLDTYQSSFALAEQLLTREAIEELPQQVPEDSICNDIICTFIRSIKFLSDIYDVLVGIINTFMLASWENQEGENPYWYSRIPDEYKDDRRYYALQYRFYQEVEECARQLDDLDRSLADVAVNPVGTDGSVDYQVPGNSANLTEALNLLRSIFGAFVPPFTMETFIVCELYPRFLVDSDETIREITKIFAQVENLPVASSFEDEHPSGRLGSVADDNTPDFSTYPDPDETCAFSPPGYGDNGSIQIDPITGEEFVAGGTGGACLADPSGQYIGLPPELALTGGYCGDGTLEVFGVYVGCPDVDASLQARLLTQGGARPPGQEGVIAPPGGGSTLFNFGLFQEAHVINPLDWSPYFYDTEEPLNYYCNRSYDQGNDPNDCQDIAQDPIDEEEDEGEAGEPLPSREINCNQSIPDSALPAGYGGGFKQNVLRLCDTWWRNGEDNDPPGSPNEYAAACYNDVVTSAQSAGVDPVFTLAIWMSESSCSNYDASRAYEAEGRDPFEDFGVISQPAYDFNAQITTFFNLWGGGSLPYQNLSRYEACFDNPNLTDFQVSMHIYLWGISGPDGYNCTNAPRSTYYDNIANFINNFISPSCGMPTDPTDICTNP